jgi:hypothetical protein
MAEKVQESSVLMDSMTARELLEELLKAEIRQLRSCDVTIACEICWMIAAASLRAVAASSAMVEISIAGERAILEGVPGIGPRVFGAEPAH